jgi:NAD(P)-dependent dehydrogenase (short-subunit alcohol dehydrogenase family)
VSHDGPDRTESPFRGPTRPLFGSGPTHTPDPVRGRLDGQLALVTGASGMLGAAMAGELSRRGADLCLLGRDLPGLLEVVDGLGPATRAAVLRCDLAVADDVVDAVEFVARLDRPVDVVVHAAGLQAGARFADGDVESLDEHYLLNVRGPYVLSQQVLGLLRPGTATFVFFSSPDVDGPSPGDVHHAITRAASLALADELRVEAADRGVRVVAVLATDRPAERGIVVDTDRFVDGVAAAVCDALAAGDIDTTELRLRSTAHPTRSERR